MRPPGYLLALVFSALTAVAALGAWCYVAGSRFIGGAIITVVVCDLVKALLVWFGPYDDEDDEDDEGEEPPEVPTIPPSMRMRYPTSRQKRSRSTSLTM